MEEKTIDELRNYNLFEGFGGNIDFETRELIDERSKKRNTNVIICLEGWMTVHEKDNEYKLEDTLLIVADNHKKYYQCRESKPKEVKSHYEIKGKAVFTMEFEPLPADVREFKIVRIAETRTLVFGPRIKQVNDKPL
ncbi:MAG: hypothetical protein WED33_05295 [Bacteroidia bacterium]